MTATVDPLADTTLVLLTLNEVEGLRDCFDAIPMDRCGEVLAVDGGSTDGTRELLAGRDVPILDQDVPGRGEAFRVAARSAKFDKLIYYSPDGNEDPGDIVRLAERLAGGADLVIASRFLPESRNEEDDHLLRPRAWVNQTYTAVANLLFNREGPWVSDCINGFRAIRKPLMDRLELTEEKFPIEYQMTIRSMKAGYRIEEFATYEGDRVGGESKAKSLSVGAGHLKILGHEVLRAAARRALRRGQQDGA
ncbi:MAG: glycosyltransferase [Myxococcota bacterium]|nr:glycosyltransferase [Myxococcota bacterium]